MNRTSGFDKLARREYGNRLDDIRFLSEDGRLEALLARARLLERIGERAAYCAEDTKLNANRLSPGCRTCVEGSWSCLFINGRCNTHCFYCPTPQSTDDPPMTNSIAFESADDYAAYVERFGFRGVSISGGEPLMTLKRSTDYLRAVNRRFGDDVHTWLYTNGTLLDRNAVRMLGDAGLDEIRFDIGAADYNLDALGLAVGVIPVVAVEIPAIPEDVPILKPMLQTMSAAGVNHLNLHQLRLTPHNYPRMITRGYNFIRGTKVTVMESELAALELIAEGLDRDIDLPINYCSFVYKHQYQGAADRRRAAKLIQKEHEGVTATGYLRQLSLVGDAGEIGALLESLGNPGGTMHPWSLRSNGTRVAIHIDRVRDLLENDRLDDNHLHVRVQYFRPRILPSLSYLNPFVTVKLTSTKTIFVEKMPTSPELEPSLDDIRWLVRTIESLSWANTEYPMREQLQKHERIERGLAAL